VPVPYPWSCCCVSTTACATGINDASAACIIGTDGWLLHSTDRWLDRQERRTAKVRLVRKRSPIPSEARLLLASTKQRASLLVFPSALACQSAEVRLSSYLRSPCAGAQLVRRWSGDLPTPSSPLRGPSLPCLLPFAARQPSFWRFLCWLAEAKRR
jgi:hypothetical protein